MFTKHFPTGTSLASGLFLLANLMLCLFQILDSFQTVLHTEEGEETHWMWTGRATAQRQADLPRIHQVLSSWWAEIPISISLCGLQNTTNWWDICPGRMHTAATHWIFLLSKRYTVKHRQYPSPTSSLTPLAPRQCTQNSIRNHCITPTQCEMSPTKEVYTPPLHGL